MQDEFALISDWYHFAILGLAEIKSSKASPLWIAKRLGITHDEAKEAVDRLLRLRIIEVENGKINQVIKNLKSTTNISDSFHIVLPKEKTCVLEQISILDKNQAGLIMHEIVYEYFASVGYKNSFKPRSYHAFVFRAYSPDQYWKFLKSLRLPIYQ